MLEMVTCAPIGTDTALDSTLPVYGLLTTWKDPGPVGVSAGMVTRICVDVPPDSGVSGPLLPAAVNKFTSGLVKPVPVMVMVCPCGITVSTDASGILGSNGRRLTPAIAVMVGMPAAALP